ncbi:MAG: HipA domain-containing protein [Proteobacteria bacterium]|nr:HipA domain-containing protein [Pseudomonadota bacterium]
MRRIGADGSIEELGTLFALAAGEFHFEARPPFAWGGLSTGLPYFLQDQRPAGFLGRAVPQRFPELGLPQRVMDWNDDHYLRYLTQRGTDTVGDLILGDVALDGLLAQQQRRDSVAIGDRSETYPRLARDVLAGHLPGSSAHGEHPKFVTMLEGHAAPRPVIVKFSPPAATAVGQRWSDLLVAEHLAHQVLHEAGIAAVQSRIEQFDDQTFLEMDRFDRVGREGRMGITSLLAIDTHLYGKLDNWIAACGRLLGDGRIDPTSFDNARLAATFGALIANPDRHFGNLAFNDRYDGRFVLSPIYDMLPMLFAPEHDQVLPREFVPPHPTADTLGPMPRPGRSRKPTGSAAPRINASAKGFARCARPVEGCSTRCRALVHSEVGS